MLVNSHRFKVCRVYGEPHVKTFDGTWQEGRRTPSYLVHKEGEFYMVKGNNVEMEVSLFLCK